jgi:hypothetical protein
MIAFLLKVFGLPGSIALGAAVLLAGAVGVQSWRLDSSQELVAAFRLAEANAAQRQALAELAHSEELRRVEKTHTENLLGIAEQLQKDNHDASAEVDRLLAGLRDGTQRLRARFQCPAADGTPGDPATAGGDPAGGTGLRAEDAGFLVRESERADVAARGLIGCMAAYNKIREANNQ